MAKSKHRFYRKILIVAGSAIMALSYGLPSYWGNLTLYVNSYFLSRVEPTLLSPWVISIFNISRTVSLFAFAAFQDGGRAWIPIVGITVTTLGLFFTYFSVQSSMAWTIVTIGGVFGLGVGIVKAWITKLIVNSSNKNLGFMNSFVAASTQCGAMLINEFVTQYINPLNQQPNFDLVGSKYFTQKVIVDRVPFTFLILGGFVIATQILGFCLINLASCIPTFSDYQSEEQSSINDTSSNCERESLQVHKTASIIQSNEHNKDLSTRASADIRQEDTNLLSQSEAVQLSDLQKQFTPKEVLKSRIFYVIWLSLVFAQFPFLLVNNFYKMFGQLRINDDHFLTFIGTVRTFSDIWGRLFWGVIIDRIGVKTNLIIVIGLGTITSFWYYFTPILDKWLYLVVTVLFGNFASGYYASFLIVAVMTFGKTNVASNLALIRSSNIVANLLAPLLFEVLLDHAGWFYTFVTTGTMNIISLLLIKFALPYN